MANKNKVKIKKWKIVVSILVLAVLAVTHLFADKIETMIGFSETLATHQITKENIENSDYYVYSDSIELTVSGYAKIYPNATFNMYYEGQPIMENSVAFAKAEDLLYIEEIFHHYFWQIRN